MVRWFSAIILFLILVGCQSKVETKLEKTKAFLYGQVANPRHSELLIFDYNSAIDTLKIDDQGRFYKVYDTVHNHFYLLKHFSESQIFFLEEGDSLGIHLNTKAFDESLTFSGPGSEKNNYLIERFLFNEDNQHLFLEKLTSAPEDYLSMADSIYEVKLKELNRQKIKFQFSDSFSTFAKTTLQYEHYFRLEEYIHHHLTEGNAYNSLKNSLITQHRSSINPNISKLSNHYIYFRMIELYIRNLTLENCLLKNGIENCSSEYKLDNIDKKQRVADSILKNDNVRRSILHRYNAQLLLGSNTKNELDRKLVQVQASKPPIKLLNNYLNLALLKRDLLPNKTINFDVKTKFNADIQLTQLLRDKNVLFFWDYTHSQRHVIQHIRVARLQKQYPNLNFIGVNVNKNQNKEWRTTLKSFNYNAFQEVQLAPQMEYDESVYINLKDALLFIDQNDTVVKSNLFLFASDIEKDLNQFSKQ